MKAITATKLFFKLPGRIRNFIKKSKPMTTEFTLFIKQGKYNFRQKQKQNPTKLGKKKKFWKSSQM